MPLTLSAPPVPRYEVKARILLHEVTDAGAHLLVLESPNVAQVARPGQFLEILFGDNYAPLVRRPFSIFRVDRKGGTVAVLYRAHGAFTSGLIRKAAGDTLSLIGPLGNPYHWTTAPDARHILVAGGIGVPPICFLATEMCRSFLEQGLSPDNIVVINGARTAEMLLGMSLLQSLPLKLFTVTDDGSHGEQAVAPELLSTLLSQPDAPPETRVYACGPMPMLRALGEIAMECNLSCQVSVETSMPCGTGVCWGCAVRVVEENAQEGYAYARACWDGPVFDSRDLLWDR